MIDIYVHNYEPMRAIKLEDTPKSIKECAEFVLDGRDGTYKRRTFGIRIDVFNYDVFSAEFGNYFVKNPGGEINIFTADTFENHYTKITEKEKDV